jgi:hypothetical protein
MAKIRPIWSPCMHMYHSANAFLVSVKHFWKIIGESTFEFLRTYLQLGELLFDIISILLLVGKGIRINFPFKD